MGTPPEPPPPLRKPRDTSVDRRLIYGIYGALPTHEGDTMGIVPPRRNKPRDTSVDPRLLYVTPQVSTTERSSFRPVANFFADFCKALIGFFRPLFSTPPDEPDFTNVFPLTSNVLSLPPQGGSAGIPYRYIEPYTPPLHYLATIEDEPIDSEWNSSDGEKIGV